MYFTASETWVELKPSGRSPPSLQESTMVPWQNLLYVFGGEVSFSCGDECPLWIYDIKVRYDVVVDGKQGIRCSS